MSRPRFLARDVRGAVGKALDEARWCSPVVDAGNNGADLDSGPTISALEGKPSSAAEIPAGAGSPPAGVGRIVGIHIRG